MRPIYADARVTLYQNDALTVLRGLPAASVQCCVTSPPYWGLRDYGTARWEGGDEACGHLIPLDLTPGGRVSDLGRDRTASGGTFHGGPAGQKRQQWRTFCGVCGARRIDAQIGLEPTPEAYVAALVEVFREVRRVLRDDGTVFLNLGDSYVSSASRRDARPDDSAGTAPRDSLALGSAYSDLCGECAVALSRRTGHSNQPHGADGRPHALTGRDNERRDFASAPLGASLLDARASTTPRSSEPPTGACLHCGNCGACLSVLRSSSRDARACVRRAERIGGSGPLASVSRNQDMGALGMACLNYSLKPKDLAGIPWRVAFALQADGWYLRADIIWAKGISFCDSYSGSAMPSSVRDRPSTAHEHVFLLSKSPVYFYDQDACRERFVTPGAERNSADPSWQEGRAKRKNALVGDSDNRTYAGADVANRPADYYGPPGGRNLRSVWTISVEPTRDLHFATMPTALVKPCVLLGTSERGCCRMCGAPWERVTRKTRHFVSGSGRAGRLPAGKNGPGMQGGGETLDVRRGPVVDSTTLGWRPTCRCRGQRGQTVPATVLDPFGGSATTALVAGDLGRRAILVELNPEYVEISRRRFGRRQPTVFSI